MFKCIPAYDDHLPNLPLDFLSVGLFLCYAMEVSAPGLSTSTHHCTVCANWHLPVQVVCGVRDGRSHKSQNVCSVPPATPVSRLPSQIPGVSSIPTPVPGKPAANPSPAPSDLVQMDTSDDNDVHYNFELALTMLTRDDEEVIQSAASPSHSAHTCPCPSVKGADLSSGTETSCYLFKGNCKVLKCSVIMMFERSVPRGFEYGHVCFSNVASNVPF